LLIYNTKRLSQPQKGYNGFFYLRNVGITSRTVIDIHD